MYATRLLPALFALVLAACGGGGGTTPSPSPPSLPPAPVRGELIGSPVLTPVMIGGLPVATLDPQVLTVLLDTAQFGTSTILGVPRCAITSYTLRYHSVGAQDEASDASAAVMLPSGADSACTGARPVLLYAHGTSLDRTFNMARLDRHNEARLVATMFAAQGFIVVAANYAGYDSSTLPYHPYLNAEQQSNDMVDALRAARRAFGMMGAAPSSKLFLTGYSQGGFVALATQRAMQTRYAGEFSVTATAGMSGPYALLRFGDTIFQGSPTIGTTAFIPLLTNAGQRGGAAVYATPGEIYEAQYATGIESLLPGALGVGELVAQGKLPETALFALDSQPQVARDFFGVHNLIRSQYRVSYLADTAARPCNVDPADPLRCAPENGLRKLMLKNDLRTYTPTTPTLLCGGHNDPTVPFYNTDATFDYFRAHGATASTLTVLDLESIPGLSNPYRTPMLSFAAAKAALIVSTLLRGDSASRAVDDAYHAGLVAPFCMMATRDFFRSN